MREVKHTHIVKVDWQLKAIAAVLALGVFIGAVRPMVPTPAMAQQGTALDPLHIKSEALNDAVERLGWIHSKLEEIHLSIVIR